MIFIFCLIELIVRYSFVSQSGHKKSEYRHVTTFSYGAILESTSTGVLNTRTVHDAPVSYFTRTCM